jgi:hypothetical protein
MSAPKPRKLPILRADFCDAFGEDADFTRELVEIAYLDRQTGEVLRVYDDPHEAYMIAGIPEEETLAEPARVAAEPARYLEIPGLDHSRHHKFLLDFLFSDWTADEALRREVEACYSGSIGRWKKAVRNRDIVHAYYDFRDRRVAELAEEFLRDHGIAPDWT